MSFGRSTFVFVAILASAPAAVAADVRPMKLVVSLSDQMLDVYDGDRLVESYPVSTGMAGHETPTGVFSILEKRRMHHSNIYSGAPMPFMQRLTWSGIALHAGRLPGYPASHGCIRLPERVAASLFRRTKNGVHVVVARSRVEPFAISHDALPKPAARIATDLRPSLVASLSADQQLSVSDAAPPVAPPAGAPAPAEPAGATPSAAPQMGPPAPNLVESYSDAPLRILLTRWSGRDRLRDIQRVLQELGYDAGEADGYMGPRTGAAIGAFQTAQGLPRTQAVSDDLVVRLYAAAGKGAPPTGRLYVRQDFKPVFDAPVTIKDPQARLGTHIYTAMEVDRVAGQARWSALELESGWSYRAANAISRFVIPGDVKARIARMLTTGSSIVVTDRGLGEDTTPKGTDFIVVTRGS